MSAAGIETQIAPGPNTAGVRWTAKRVHQNRAIKYRIREIQGRLEVKALLSLNDRLAILARDTQILGTTPAMIIARTRAIEVYSRLSGDQPGERQEVRF